MNNLKKKLFIAMSGMLLLAVLAFVSAVSSAAAGSTAENSDLGFKVFVEVNNITVEGVPKVYVDTMKNGKVKSSEVYTTGMNGKIEIDLSYMNGKENELQIYKDGGAKLTVNVEKQVKKVKPVFNAMKKSLTVTSEAKGDYCIVLGNDSVIATGAGMENIDYDKYMVKGAAGYVYYPGTVEGSSSEGYTITPDSKQGKFKVPAKKAGPKIAFDVETLSFKVPKDCTYKITQVSRGAFGNASYQKDVSGKALAVFGNTIKVSEGYAVKIGTIVYEAGEEIKDSANVAIKDGKVNATLASIKVGDDEDVNSTDEVSVGSAAKVSIMDKSIKDNNIDITNGSITIELWKNATDKKPASKVKELKVSRQELINDVKGTGLTYTVKYKTVKVKIDDDFDDDWDDDGDDDWDEGYYSKAYNFSVNSHYEYDDVPVAYILKNETGKDCQLALVDKKTDISSIDLPTAKIKWKKVKAGGTVSYKLNKMEGKKVIYRIAGEKPGKKNNNTLKLPSTIGYIKPMVSFDYIFVNIKKPAKDEAKDVTVSCTSITVNGDGEGEYYYKLCRQSEFIYPKVGDPLPADVIKINAGETIILKDNLTKESSLHVYKIDEDGDVIGYDSTYYLAWYMR